MSVSKIVRTSLAMSACVSLLAACGDRAGGFRAKKWTNAEIQANMAAKQAQENAQFAAKTSNENSPVAPPPPPPPSGGGDDAGKGNLKNGNSPNKPANPPPDSSNAGGPKDGPGAQSNVIDEKLPIGDQFIKENVQLLGTIDPSLTKLVKGITAGGTVGTVGTKAAIQVSIDAAIVIGKDTRYVSVAPKAVTFDEKDNKIVKLVPEIRENADGDGAKVTVNDLQILAACLDSNCSQVHVRVTIPVEGGKAALAFVLSGAKSKGTYEVSAHNMKEWVEFKTWLEQSKKDKDKPEKVDTTVDDGKGGKGNGNSDGQGGESKVDKNKGDSDKSAAEKKAADEKAAADKKAADDKAAADKKAADDKAAADKKAADDKAAANAIFNGKQPAQKSVAFKPVTDGSQPSTADLAKDTTSAGKTFQMTQDPGPFKFDTPQQKPPGIFGSTTGLTGNAVKSAEAKAPAATTPAPAAPAAAAPAAPANDQAAPAPAATTNTNTSTSLRGKSAEMDAMADAFQGDDGKPVETTASTVGQAPTRSADAQPQASMKVFGGEGDAVATAPAMSEEEVQNQIQKGF